MCIILATLFLTLLLAVHNDAIWEFTNIECETLSPDFVIFNYCHLKSVNRTYKYISVYANILKKPIMNASVRVQSMRKFNGYKPGLYNILFDACKFLKSRRNLLISFFFDIIKNDSNMNHSCPFNHDLVIEKLPISHLNHMLTNVLPVPHGDYALFTTWISAKKPRATIKFYVTYK